MRRTNWIWVVLGILLASCGGTGTDAEAVTTTAGASATTATSAATTTEAPTTTVAETTTTTVPGCDDAEGIDVIERIETHPMDVNGDGVDDQVTVFFDDSNSNMPHFGLLVEYASGGSARIDRPVYGGLGQPLIPMGLYDIDGDGTPEMFVVEYVARLGLGYEPEDRSVKLLLLLVGECSLSDTDDMGGLAISRYPTQGIHAHCVDGAVRVYDYYTETQDKTAFNVGVYEKTLENGVMVFNRLENQQIPKQEMLDMPLFDCGDLQLPAERPPA